MQRLLHAVRSDPCAACHCKCLVRKGQTQCPSALFGHLEGIVATAAACPICPIVSAVVFSVFTLIWFVAVLRWITDARPRCGAGSFGDGGALCVSVDLHDDVLLVAQTGLTLVCWPTSIQWRSWLTV